MTLQRRTLLAGGVSAMGLGLSGCAALGLGGWTTLVDGSSMTMADFAAWGKLGEGNWSMGEGTLQGRAGKMGYLVSPQSYTDFEIRAEFWADKPANSGIFIRCQDPKNVGAANSYEVNIFDTRPDPSYGTAAIVDFAKAPCRTLRRPTSGTPSTSRPKVITWWWFSTARKRWTSGTASSAPARSHCSRPAAPSAGARWRSARSDGARTARPLLQQLGCYTCIATS
jgi:hypothetical protein